MQSIVSLTPTRNGTAVNALVYGKLIMTPAGATTIVTKNGNNTANFTAASVLGDYIDLQCDGVYWYCNGSSTIAAGFS